LVIVLLGEGKQEAFLAVNGRKWLACNTKKGEQTETCTCYLPLLVL